MSSYNKHATTIECQLELLKQRGLIIRDEGKSSENLLDIGYYRFCFYLFPFEITYPSKRNRTHEVEPGTVFDDALWLYYFDFDMRQTLMRYLLRLEISLRTKMIYLISNKYPQSSTWFVDTSIVANSFAHDFPQKVYTSDFLKNGAIKSHHKKYINDKYAPAWKTLEFMTFGSIIKLYESLKDTDDKLLVSKEFGINQTAVFESYMKAMQALRNICAHGAVLFDSRLPQSINNGPAGRLGACKQSLGGMIRVLSYLIGQISQNRKSDLVEKVREIYSDLQNKSPKAYCKLLNITKFNPNADI